MPFDAFHVFENIMENGAFAPNIMKNWRICSFGANAPFSITFSNVFKTSLKFFMNFFQYCQKIENDVMI